MAEGDLERGGSYVRLNPDESPMTLPRLRPYSPGSRSLGPSATPSEHYVRRKTFTKYSSALRALIPYRRKFSVVTELPLDDIGFLSTVTYSWMTAFLRKSWVILPQSSLTCAKLDSCNINSQRLKDFLRDENVRRGQVNARILCTAWRFVRTRILIAAIIYILSAAMYIVALVVFLTWFLETREMYNLLILMMLFSSSLLLLFWSNSLTFRSANRLQSAFMSIMYKHLLRVSVLHSISAHRIVSVMASDSEKVHEAVVFLPIVLTVPFILLLPIPMFLTKMKCYSTQDYVFSIISFILITPILYLLARLSNVWKSHMCLFTGKRMMSLQEMLLHIPLVKMTVREKLFHKNAEDLRQKECHYMRKVNTCDGISVTFLHIIPLLVAVLLWHQSTNNVVTVRNINKLCEEANLFSVIILLLIPLKELLFNFWYGMTKILDGLMALRRLKRILLLSTITKTSSRKPMNHLIALSVNEATYTVKVTSCTKDRMNKRKRCICSSCYHQEEDDVEMQTKSILKNISLGAPKEKLIGICGDVSSGKTALILAILEQITPSYGGDKLQRDGSYAYVGQNPWILEATLQENILFNETFVHKKYYHIVHSCSLTDDIGHLPGGDQTLISEHTLTLGQKQRIALARALYANRDIYLLDDLLSAVNSETGILIFERTIQNYFKGKTVIITSRQVKFLRLCDEIFVLKKGEIVENGTHDELLEKEVYPALVKTYLQEKNPNKIENIKSYTTLTSNESYGEGEIRSASSFLKIPDSLDEENENKHDSVDLDVKYNNSVSFFKTMTSETNTSIPLVASLISRILCIIFIISCPVFIIKYFIAGTEGFIIVLGFLLLILLIRIAGIISYEKVSYNISLHIHKTWIENVCKCCFNVFQNTSHSEVLRWFSLHLSEIDIGLPSNSIAFLENSFLAVALIIILVFCSFWFLIPLIAIFLAGHFLLFFTKAALEKFYNQEEDACSNLNGFVSSTIMGRVTIQAYGQEQEYWSQFHNCCDKLLAYSHLRKAAVSWLSFWIHIASLSLIMVALGCLCIESQLAGDMKKWIFTLHQNEDNYTTITTMTIFSVILFGCILNNMVNSSASISFKFAVLGLHDATIRSIKQEECNPDPCAPNPFSNGNINFQNVKLEFWPDSPFSCRGLSFQVQAGEKIGVLGLPGSGKTAIIGALFKLANISQGCVTVGGINTATTPVEYIRSSIALVPKNPVIFSGTLRLNIDPMQKYSIRELNDCLEKVDLLQTINDLPNHLDTHALNLEGSLSIDERQLLYVAQALLRDPQILILEEPMQPVGTKNMYRVQDVVSQLFHCTILIVANNMKYASKCDRIMIIKDGQVVEFDTPENLFRNPKSCFSQMLFSSSDNSLETEV